MNSFNTNAEVQLKSFSRTLNKCFCEQKLLLKPRSFLPFHNQIRLMFLTILFHIINYNKLLCPNRQQSQSQLNIKYMMRVLSHRSLILTQIQFNFSRISVRGVKPAKEKYRKNIKQEAFEQQGKQFMRDAFQEYKKQAQKDSIIKDFRRDIFKKQSIPQSMLQADQLYDRQQDKVNRQLNYQKNPERAKKFSKKLMEKFINSHQTVKNKDLFRDHADYTTYDSTYTKLGDRRLGNRQMLDNNNDSQRIYKFIQKLPDEYAQKQEVKNYLRSIDPRDYKNKTIGQFGKQTQEIMNLARVAMDLRHEKGIHVRNDMDILRVDQHDQTSNYDDFNTMIAEKLNPNKPPTLSPEAINKIYELYIQGWKIRDICKRFGIMPQRAKFCVWVRAQLYNQVLPKTGIKQYVASMQAQKYHSQQQGGYMDYGIDLNEMNSTAIFGNITSWESETVDVQRKPHEYTEALRKLEKTNKGLRYQMVEVGTHGKQGKRYLLKEWNIFKGKWSNEYHLRWRTYRSYTKQRKKMLYTYY